MMRNVCQLLITLWTVRPNTIGPTQLQDLEPFAALLWPLAQAKGGGWEPKLKQTVQVDQARQCKELLYPQGVQTLPAGASSALYITAAGWQSTHPALSPPPAVTHITCAINYYCCTAGIHTERTWNMSEMPYEEIALPQHAFMPQGLSGPPPSANTAMPSQPA